MEGQGAKCLVMALCLGPGGPKVFFDTYSHTRMVQNWGRGPWPPWLLPGSATGFLHLLFSVSKQVPLYDFVDAWSHYASAIFG